MAAVVERPDLQRVGQGLYRSTHDARTVKVSEADIETVVAALREVRRARASAEAMNRRALEDLLAVVRGWLNRHLLTRVK